MSGNAKTQVTPDAGYDAAYSYADELPSPSEVGVRSSGDIDAITDAVGAVNYYVDAIGFGQKTLFNRHDMNPLGLRYFMNTGSTCSNGAVMYDYVDTTPKGDLLGQRVKTALSDMGLPGMRGLAPGIMEDARDALNPMPLLRAAMGSGYPQCRQVTLPVGDLNGNISSPHEANKNWITGTTTRSGNQAMQTRWVQDRDSKGRPLFMDQEAYNASKKIYNPDGTPIEGFDGAGFLEKYIDKQTAAALMFGGIVLAFITISMNRK
jgi:hypothetical protein